MELELYKALVAYIKSKMTTIKTVALWNNQIYNENVEIPFLYPAIFIEFTDKQFRELSVGVQQVDMTVNIRLCFQSYKTDDISILQLKQDVYEVINRFYKDTHPANYFTKLLRTTESQDFNHDNIQMYTTGYRTSGKDYTTDRRPNIPVSATPSITTIII